MRTMIFQHSATIIKTIIRRLIDASAHLQRHDEESVIDAIYELELDIARIRCLMFLTHDFNESKEKNV